MKTAEEWHRIYAAQNYTWLEILKLAQADALRHAVDRIAEDWALGGSDMAVRGCVKFLRNEAKKLEAK